MSLQESQSREPTRHRRGVVAGVLGVMLIGTVIVATSADAAPSGYNQDYFPETASGFTNTFSSKAALTPACPQALAGTPGSDPAAKVLNGTLNAAPATPGALQPGGLVHFTYTDNPHDNGGTANFTIQDCVVAYPSTAFQASDFGANGVLINASKSVLKGGTQIDGAELNGISAPTGPIYFSWKIPAATNLGTWLCSFARDIRNNHFGGGNRKVPPTCFQVKGPPPPTPDVVKADIFLGYADSYHTVNGARVQFTPWSAADLSDASIRFFGCKPTSAACDLPVYGYDGGAIKIVNAGTVTLTLESASVDIGPCHFDPWTNAIGPSIAPGESYILTQTGTDGFPLPTPCSNGVPPSFWTQTNFDTSEQPAGLNCDTAGLTPMINLKFSGQPAQAVPDTNKILNNGGIDGANCPGSRPNAEGTVWTPV